MTTADERIEANGCGRRAHSIVNQLAIILASSKPTARSLDAEAQARLQLVHDAIERIRALVGDPDRLHARGSAAVDDLESWSVCELLSAVVHACQPIAEEQHVELVTRCASGSVVGDRDVLHALLLDALVDAIHSTSHHGGVFVAAYETPRGDQEWLVQTTGSVDHGSAGDERVRQHERARGDRHRSPGLERACAVIDRRSGTVRIRSVHGSGTAVYVSFPSRLTDSRAR